MKKFGVCPKSFLNLFVVDLFDKMNSIVMSKKQKKVSDADVDVGGGGGGDHRPFGRDKEDFSGHKSLDEDDDDDDDEDVSVDDKSETSGDEFKPKKNI